MTALASADKPRRSHNLASSCVVSIAVDCPQGARRYGIPARTRPEAPCQEMSADPVERYDSPLGMAEPRTLSRVERRAVLSQLRNRWPSDDQGWWHPLDACTGSEVLVLETGWFEHEVDLNDLRDRLRSEADQVVWQVAEGTPHWDDDPPDDPIGQDYLLALHRAPLAVGGSETIWVPTSLTWLIYTGHDQNSYFVGSELVRIVKAIWPNWEHHCWSSTYYARPSMPE